METMVIEQTVAQGALTISLDAITMSETNDMFRRSHEITHAALQELADSIHHLGVIQPVTVRPDPKVAAHYILISGERRFRASKLAGKTDIPAYVREVSEEVALLMQITENIQRENVHPLNEAKGYKAILENDPTLSTSELARRFGKSESYILQRLKLNDLVKDARKDFYDGRMSLGHAVIIARLIPEDQKQLINQMINRRNGYGTVADLSDYVERNVTNSLSSAAFDKKDAELFKKAGACTTCPKRSGASPLLFSDIKQKDRCFDRGCFFTKCQRHLLHKTTEVIETHPDVALLSDYSKVDEQVAKILTEHKITPLKEYDDFSVHQTSGKKVSGLWISGNDAGKMVTVFLKKEVKELSDETPEMKIEKIQHRMVRGKELDQDKVYAKILESLVSHPSQKKTYSKKLMADEEVMLWYIIYDKASYSIKEDLQRAMDLRRDTPDKLYNAIRSMKPEDRAFMLRRVMMDQYGGNNPRSSYGFIIKKIAAGYGDIDISSFEKEQGEICSKRESRAKERIKDLHALQANRKKKSKNTKGA